MTNTDDLVCRNFISYSGVKLPLKLISPIDGETLDGRITFFRGYYDSDDRLVKIEKVVYGEVEFTHHYDYSRDGRLKTAELIEADCEPRVMSFS